MTLICNLKTWSALAVMKFLFGWNISIIGSGVFTLIFSVIFAIIDRR